MCRDIYVSVAGVLSELLSPLIMDMRNLLQFGGQWKNKCTTRDTMYSTLLHLQSSQHGPLLGPCLCRPIAETLVTEESLEELVG